MQWNLEQDQKDIKDKISQHACLWWKTIYSVAEIEKKYPQVYLEKCKYKKKTKIKMPEFIDAVLESELVLVLNNLLFVDCVLNNA